MCKRHTRTVPDKQKAGVKELVVDNSTNNSSSDITRTRFLCSEKEKTVFTEPKGRQVKHYSNKQAVTLSIGSVLAKKNF